MESSNRAVFEPESLCAERKSKMKRDGPKQKTPLRNKWLGKQNKKKKKKGKLEKRQENQSIQEEKSQYPYTHTMNTHTQTHTHKDM